MKSIRDRAVLYVSSSLVSLELYGGIVSLRFVSVV